MGTKEKVNDRKAEAMQNKDSFIEERKQFAVLALCAEGGNQLLAISGAHRVLLSGVE